ncbi:MAG: HEAT repeat domain-containing protein, partial [Planctomycetota bacterium]
MTDFPGSSRPATDGPATGGPTTGRGKKGRPQTPGNQWQSWWRTNRQPFVTLAGPLKPRSETGARGLLTGGGRRNADSSGSVLSDEDLREKVLPALRLALRSDDPMLMHDAALAIGRVEGALDGETLDLLRKILKSRHLQARHAAILALGLSGERSALPILWNIVHDTAEARAALSSKGRVGWYERVSAIVAFGMSCEPSMQPGLCRLAEREVHVDRQLGGSAVLALGLVREPSLETIRFLGDLLQDDRLHWSVAAQVPVALARHGEVAAPFVPLLLTELTNSKRVREVRQSCAIALGRLAIPEDDEVVRALRKLTRKETD